MIYYLRATGNNIYQVGTEKWMEILDVKKVQDEYYELEVDTPTGNNRYVCIDRDRPCTNLDFAKEYLGLYYDLTHTQFLNEVAGAVDDA